MSNQDTSRVFNSFVPLVQSGQTVEVGISQTLVRADSNGGVSLLDVTGDSTVHVSVEGPQVSLLDTDIAGVYPTPGSDTSPDEFLPHIALTRRTLPWEREGPTPKSPWLALLLLRTSEIGHRFNIGPIFGLFDGVRSRGSIGTVDAIGTTARATRQPVRRTTSTSEVTRVSESRTIGRITEAASGVGGGLEAAEVTDPGSIVLPSGGGPPIQSTTIGTMKTSHPDAYSRFMATGLTDSTKVDVVFVPTNTFKEVLSLDDLPLLCHVRRAAKDNPLAKLDEDRDLAVVMSGRLPYSGASGEKPEVHHAYLVSLEQRTDLVNPTTSTVPLVVLHYWTFTPTQSGDFEAVIKAIRVRPNGGVLRFGNLPRGHRAGEPELSGGFAAMLDDAGYLLPPARLHQSGSEVEYRGPLRPFAPPPRSNAFAVRPAPEEFEGADPTDPPDYSHAIAFEIGRLATLAGEGLPELLHQISIKAVVPEVEPPVLVDQLPDALRKPDWVVNPQWWKAPYVLPGTLEAPANQQMLKNEALLLQAGQADFTGIAAQSAPWKNAVVNKIETMAGIEQPSTQIDIGTVSEQALHQQFADIVAATLGK